MEKEPKTKESKLKKREKDKSLRMMEKIVKRHEKHSENITKEIEPDEQLKKKKGTKKSWFLIARVGLIIVLVAVGGIYFLTQNKGETDSGDVPFSENGMVISEETVYASGTTSIGTVTEDFSPDYITTQLYIEAVYLSTGDEITEGTAILKISDDSLEEARKELEDASELADLAYRAGLIEYEQSKITTKYDYDSIVLEAKQALEVYNETIADLNLKLEEAEEAVSDAQEELDEYTDALNNDTYATKYTPKEKLALYNENLALLNSKSDEWGIPYSEYTSMVGGGGSSYDQWELITLKLLYAELEENLNECNQAQEDYDNAVENATLQVKKLTLSITTLKKILLETQESFETKKIEAETTYQIALAKSDMAQGDYDTALSKAEEEYDNLLDTKEEADDNLNEFEKLIGDGYLYSSSNGEVLKTLVTADSILQGDSIVMAYSNPDIVTISVSVDQADISKIDIGDQAYVLIEGYGNYTGVVEEIDPISTSTSRTSITYNVTVSIDSEDQSLTSNLTTEVYFNMGEQMQ